MQQYKNVLSNPVYYPQSVNRNVKIPSFSGNMTSPTNAYSHPINFQASNFQGTNFQGTNFQKTMTSPSNYQIISQGKQNSFKTTNYGHKRSRAWEKIEKLLEKPVYYPEEVRYNKYSKINYYEGRQNYHMNIHNHLTNFKSLQHGQHHHHNHRALYHSEEEKYEKCYHVGKGDDYPNPPPPVSRYQNIPYMRRYYEYEPRQIVQKIVVPVQRQIQDYYKIQHITDYVPQQIEEVIVDYVPQEKIVNKLQYIPIEQQIIHVPQEELIHKGHDQHLHAQVHHHHQAHQHGSFDQTHNEVNQYSAHQHEIRGSFNPNQIHHHHQTHQHGIQGSFNPSHNQVHQHQIHQHGSSFYPSIASPYFNTSQQQNRIKAMHGANVANTSQVVSGFSGVQTFKNYNTTQNALIKQYISSQPIPVQFANNNNTRVTYQQANKEQNLKNISGFKVLEGQRFLGTITGSRYKQMIDQGLINKNQSKQMYTGGQRLIQQPNPKQIYQGQQINRVSTSNKNVASISNGNSVNQLPQQDRYQQTTLNQSTSSKIQRVVQQLVQNTDSVIRKEQVNE